eukprot:m.144998 g.144998  ORF g.144998 m.144998 type:complete len:611 (-) comp17211_c0_seq1:56-1888(-)
MSADGRDEGPLANLTEEELAVLRPLVQAGLEPLDAYEAAHASGFNGVTFALEYYIHNCPVALGDDHGAPGQSDDEDLARRQLSSPPALAVPSTKPSSGNAISVRSHSYIAAVESEQDDIASKARSTSLIVRSSKSRNHRHSSNASAGSGKRSDLFGWVSQQLTRLHSVSEEYYCQICLDFVPVSEGYTLQGCEHVFCRPCISQFAAIKIREAQVYMVCPHIDDGDEPDCQQEIQPADIEALIDEETMLKYCKFKLNKDNPCARQCPKCDMSIIGNPKRPAMTCPSCNTQFCFTHGQAHPPTVTCKQYEASRRQEEKSNRAALAKTTKACPGCSAPVEFRGGCNHMTCICGTEFCWLCGRTITGGELPLHYALWNPFGCTGGQFAGSDAEQDRCCSYRCTLIWLARVLVAPILGLLVLTLALAFSWVLLPLYVFCWKRTFNKKGNSFTAFLGSSFQILFLGFAGLFMGCLLVATLPLWLLLGLAGSNCGWWSFGDFFEHFCMGLVVVVVALLTLPLLPLALLAILGVWVVNNVFCACRSEPAAAEQPEQSPSPAEPSTPLSLSTVVGVQPSNESALSVAESSAIGSQSSMQLTLPAGDEIVAAPSEQASQA